jgi:hypothetical protein
MTSTLVSDPQLVLDRIFDLLKIDNTSSLFPGPQPSALSHKALQDVVLRGNREYWVCEKTDGVRKLVYFSRVQKFLASAECPGVNTAQNSTTGNCANSTPDWEHLVLTLDRRLEICRLTNEPPLAELQISDPLFDGTVLDAELTADGKFVAFDCYAFAGQPCSHRNLGVRLSFARAAVKACNPPTPHEASEACTQGDHFEFEQDTWHREGRFELKPMFLLKDIQRFVQVYQRRLDRRHSCDGVIFNPVSDQMYCGTHPFMFKFKRPEDHTCDFLIKTIAKDGPKFAGRFNTVPTYVTPEAGATLQMWWLDEGGSLACFHAINFQRDQETGEAWRDDQIWEFSLIGTRWTPIRHRADRRFPNNKTTVLNTLTCLKSPVRLEDLF